LTFLAKSKRVFGKNVLDGQMLWQRMVWGMGIDQRPERAIVE